MKASVKSAGNVKSQKEGTRWRETGEKLFAISKFPLET